MEIQPVTDLPVRNQDNKPKILVIDDSKAIRHYINDLLTKTGYQVALAEDGQRGIEAAAVFDPDVILLDIDMPGISGLEVLAELCKVSHLFSIIMFSGNSSQGSIVIGLERGADDYITKPIRENEMIARIGAAVRSTNLKRSLAEARRVAVDALSQLRTSQERLIDVEKVNSIARLAAGVAHHVNNPLGFIHCNVASLEKYAKALLRYSDDLKTLIPETRKEELKGFENCSRIDKIRYDMAPLLEETNDGISRIALIVKRLSQLERGFIQGRVVIEDLNLIVEQTIQDIKAYIPLSIKVEWEPASEPLPVLCSMMLISSALANLIDNAIDASEEQSIVRINTISNHESVCVSICDNGPGFKPEAMSHLFEPFYSTKEAKMHVGLGLTVAQEFIVCQGGRIEVSSHNGGGACVTVILPRSKELPLG